MWCVVLLLQAIPLLKESIQRAYGMKGEKVVAENFAAVDGALKDLKKIDIPISWHSMGAGMGHGGLSRKITASSSSSTNGSGSSSYIKDIVRPMLALEGDAMPVR
jgi:pyruvate-ferredoxin/flavodoxin oxidoreductase